jgi:hypothetical protein
VILPSVSLVSGISVRSDEGLFRRELANYLKMNGYEFLDLYSEEKLNKTDFWQHEGHLNAQGNMKVAKALFEFLKIANMI